MKYILPLILNLTIISGLSAQSVSGKWNTGRGGVVEIYECGSQLCGRLVQSDNPDRKDAHNPDPAKRNETLIGTNILRGFHYKGDLVWKDGKIYNPNNGKSYSAKLTLDGDVLKVRGFKGISLFGKTVKWTRVE